MNESNTNNAQEAQTAGAVALKLLGDVQGNEAAGITKVPQTPQEMRVIEVSEALVPAYQKASMLDLTDEEVTKLTAPFPDEVVEIRPHDGLIFISHIFISDRLNKVFKPGQWALMRRREWFDEATNVMYGEYVLTIRGCYVGESVGGHPYLKNNPKTNYSDVLESTAAEALRRICGKRLSCGSQVWNPEYARQWVEQYAHVVGGKWAKKRSGLSVLHPTAGPPSDKVEPNKVVPMPSQEAPRVGNKTLEDRIAGLKFKLGRLVGWAEGYLRNYTVDGSDANASIMHNEGLEALNEDQVDYLAKNWKEFEQRLQQFVDENEPSDLGPEVAAEPEPDRPSSSPVEEEPLEMEPEDERWRTFPMPWGARAGVQLAKLDKKYLYGLWANYTVETTYKGKPKKPETIAKDKLFRQMLDDAGRHYEFTKED